MANETQVPSPLPLFYRRPAALQSQIHLGLSVKRRVDFRARAQSKAPQSRRRRAPAMGAVPQQTAEHATAEQQPFPSAAEEAQHDAAKREAGRTRQNHSVDVPFMT